MDSVQAHNRRQRGAYAIEFAIVFPIFFLLVYAILTYGLIFAAQQSLNFAAESAARSALQWQPGDAATGRVARMELAHARATELTRWVGQMAGVGQLQIQVCDQQMMSGLGDHQELCTAINATADQPTPSIIEVVVRYPYSDAPLVPMLGPDALFRILVPAALYGRASVDLNIALGLV